MKIKYSPTHNDEHNTDISYIDGNTLKIDDEEYQFDEDSVEWPDIAEQTDYKILEAKRIDGELVFTVRRFYTQLSRPDWDTGDYHDIEG